MNKKKVLILLGIVVVIAAAGGAGYYFREDLMEVIPFLGGGSSDDKVYVEKVSKLMNQSTGVMNRYNGIVETQETYEVNVDSSRNVKEVLVKVGDTVEEGQELLKYDTSELEMQIKQAELEKEGINNEIASYTKQIETLTAERAAVGEADTFSYTTEIQSLENSIEQSKFDLESKQLEIDQHKEQLAKSTVVSKQGGVVKEINENGSNSMGDSAAFMTILKTGDYRVKGNVDEQNVWTITEGQAVIIRSRVQEDTIWRGTISKIDTKNTVSDNSDSYESSDSMESSTKYPFYIELESAEGLLLGQHVYIEMDEGQSEKKEGLWLFSSYIVQEETGNYVWVANDKDRIEKRSVELGEYDEELDAYEILSGLADNDYIAWPMEGLYEGVATVTNAEEVDYSSPLYNGEELFDTEMSEGDEYTEHIRGEEALFEDWEEEFATETFSVEDTEFDEEWDDEEYIESVDDTEEGNWDEDDIWEEDEEAYDMDEDAEDAEVEE